MNYLDNTPESFDQFFDELVEKLSLGHLSEDDLTPFYEEAAAMFNAALFEAATKVLDAEDHRFIDAYLIEHPEVSDIDAYFLIASEKPNVRQVLHETLEELFERIVYLKDKISNE